MPLCGSVYMAGSGIFSLNTYMSKFAKAETFEWFILVYIQPGVDCPLWNEQSS